MAFIQFFCLLKPITNNIYVPRSTASSTVEPDQLYSITETNHDTDRGHGQFLQSNNNWHYPEIVQKNVLQLHRNISSWYRIINNSSRLAQGHCNENDLYYTLLTANEDFPLCIYFFILSYHIIFYLNSMWTNGCSHINTLIMKRESRIWLGSD